VVERVRKLWSVVFVLPLAACGGQVVAAPVVEQHAPASVPPSSAAPGTLAALDPCGLLSPTDRSTAGVSVLGKPKAIADTRACDWTMPGTFGVTVTLDDKVGLAGLDVARKTATKTKVGTHQAMQVSDRKAADGTCAVLLAVGTSANVQIDVSNNSFSDTPLACRRAGTVAGLVEPKLP